MFKKSNQSLLYIPVSIFILIVIMPMLFPSIWEAKKAFTGETIAKESPFADYVVTQYTRCLNPGLFSLSSEAQCKVSIAQLVKIEKDEASVPIALSIINRYEAQKLESFGFKNK